MRKLSIEELNRVSIEEFKSLNKLPLVVVLDNIRSTNNIGSIFRTCDAFCVSQIAICGISATPPNKEIHKTAIGAEQSVDWQYFPTTIDAIESLKVDGFKVMAVEQAEGSIDIRNFNPNSSEKYAFILGNEVEGVSDDVMELVDGCIEIPQYGTKHSLNVSITAGIMLYDYHTKTDHIVSDRSCESSWRVELESLNMD